jgi:antitoxin HigA-1
MKKKLRNIHPGEVLREEFILPLGITQYALAVGTGIPHSGVTALVHERRSVTADTAHRLARYFGVSPEFWLGLQRDYDLEKAARTHAAAYRSIKPLAIPA